MKIYPRWTYIFFQGSRRTDEPTDLLTGERTNGQTDEDNLFYRYVTRDNSASAKSWPVRERLCGASSCRVWGRLWCRVSAIPASLPDPRPRWTSPSSPVDKTWIPQTSSSLWSSFHAKALEYTKYGTLTLLKNALHLSCERHQQFLKYENRDWIATPAEFRLKTQC